MMLNEPELDLLERRCREVPLTRSTYIATDFVACLLDTVMDYQNHTRTVEKAIEHFNKHRWNDVRTCDDLQGVLASYPDDQDGNRALAQHLWGNNHWRRAQELRGLVRYFDELQVRDLDGLKEWAGSSTARDFVGKVRGLGPVVYQWLVMRLGTETVKPDTHVLRFVSDAIGRKVGEQDAIQGVVAIAERLGVKANLLDWSIWEFQRREVPLGGGGGGSLDTDRRA